MSEEATYYDNILQWTKGAIPWYAKIAAKLALSRLPIPYGFWRRVGLYRWGAMDIPQQALNDVLAIVRQTEYANRLDGLSILEIGPGDSLSTALIAHALGARQTVLVDAGSYATRDMETYRALAKLLQGESNSFELANQASDVDALLAIINGRYLTAGLRSLKNLSPGSIDFSFSKAVLEHIRFAEFYPMMCALRAAMAPSGVSYHFIDLEDHLAHALNNLRFSDRVWESEFMARSGFYTNRIGYSEMIAMFERAGFEVQVLSVSRFDHLPTPRSRMAKQFQARSDADLMVSGFSVLLRPV